MEPDLIKSKKSAIARTAGAVSRHVEPLGTCVDQISGSPGQGLATLSGMTSWEFFMENGMKSTYRYRPFLAISVKPATQALSCR